MGWRTVVISNNAKLDYQMGFLVVRRLDMKKIHISELETLIIESTAVSMTAALLCELNKKKVKVIFCDEKRNPSSELVSYYGSHDSSAKIRNQISWIKETKDIVWTEIVKEKIQKQAEHLSIRNKWDEAQMLQNYAMEIGLADDRNREGHAAKVYFNALFGKDFTRTAENSTNAALNYGYSLLLSSFNRCVVANGYLTQLGLFHDNMFNPFNFSSDLMEPFRPLVDYMVIELKPEKFEIEEKRYMLTLLEKEVNIGGRTEFISNAIKIYCKSIFDAINENDLSLVRFYKNEF